MPINICTTIFLTWRAWGGGFETPSWLSLMRCHKRHCQHLCHGTRPSKGDVFCLLWKCAQKKTAALGRKSWPAFHYVVLGSLSLPPVLARESCYHVTWFGFITKCLSVLFRVLTSSVFNVPLRLLYLNSVILTILTLKQLRLQIASKYPAILKFGCFL